MKYLSVEDILLIHSAVVDETGGSHGVRDMNALLTMEALPQQAMFGNELYETIWKKSATYVRSIIFNHPFIDGNKRTAIALAARFLSLNGYELIVSNTRLEHFVLFAVVKKYDLKTTAAWFKKHSKRI